MCQYRGLLGLCIFLEHRVLFTVETLVNFLDEYSILLTYTDPTGSSRVIPEREERLTILGNKK